MKENNNMEENKNNFCERCGREINHKGRCLPCNYLYKHKKYFPGLRESPDYDAKYGMDTTMVKSLIEKEGKIEKDVKDIKIEKKKEYKYEKICIFCNNSFQTNNDEFQSCYKCFRFFSQFGGIKNYNEFLQAFDLSESIETKEKYIQFVDNVKRFLEIKGDWKIDRILENPGEFLDKVKK